MLDKNKDIFEDKPDGAHSIPDKDCNIENIMHDEISNQEFIPQILNSARVPITEEQRVPPLTDRMNTNLKNFDTSRISQNL